MILLLFSSVAPVAYKPLLKKLESILQYFPYSSLIMWKDVDHILSDNLVGGCNLYQHCLSSLKITVNPNNIAHNLIIQVFEILRLTKLANWSTSWALLNQNNKTFFWAFWILSTHWLCEPLSRPTPFIYRARNTSAVTIRI